MGELGKEKLARVKKNSDYFRDSLIAMYVAVVYVVFVVAPHPGAGQRVLSSTRLVCRVSHC